MLQLIFQSRMTGSGDGNPVHRFSHSPGGEVAMLDFDFSASAQQPLDRGALSTPTEMLGYAMSKTSGTNGGA
jgi:hypothetical protein